MLIVFSNRTTFRTRNASDSNSNTNNSGESDSNGRNSGGSDSHLDDQATLRYIILFKSPQIHTDSAIASSCSIHCVV